MPESYEYDVFISYSHKDKEWVRRRLLPRLEDAGLRVCIDERDFQIGRAAILNMQDAVEQSRYILPVITQNWIDSSWTNLEALMLMIEDPLDTRLVPIVLEKGEIPRRLAILSYIDFTEPARREEQFRRLLAELTEMEPQTSTKTPLRDPKIDSRIPKPRLASYILALLVALITFAGLASSLGDLSAIVVASVIFLLLLVNLSNVEEGLIMLSRDAPIAYQKAKNLLAEDRPRAFQEIIGSLIQICRLSLFKPTQFATARFTSDRNEHDVSKVKIALALAALLYSNLLLASSLLWEPLAFHVFFVSIFCLIPLALALLDIFITRKADILTTSSTPLIVWFFVLGFWFLFIFTLSSWTNPDELTGSNILIGTCLIGFLGGTLSAIVTHINSPLQWPLHTMAFTLVVVLFVFLHLESREEPLARMSLLDTDPLLAQVQRSLNNDGIQFQEYSTPPAILKSEENQSPTTSDSGYISEIGFTEPVDLSIVVFILSTVGTSAGFVIGRLGIIPFVLGSLKFYFGWILMSVGDDRRGMRLIREAVDLDDWRLLRWPGESKCYEMIRHRDPNELIAMLVPQTAHSARRGYALNQLASQVIALAPEEVAQMLAPLIPLSQYEYLTPWLSPKTSLLSSTKTSQHFETIYTRRRSLFSDVFERMRLKSDYSSLPTYGQILRAFDRIAHARWDQSSEIQHGLMRYRTLPHVRGLYLLASSIEASLQVTRIEQVCTTAQKWHILREETHQDQKIAHLKWYTRKFLHFAELIGELEDFQKQASSEKNMKILAEASFTYLAIQGVLVQQSDNFEELVGLDGLRLVSEHWGDLLRTVIRRHSYQP